MINEKSFIRISCKQIYHDERMQMECTAKICSFSSIVTAPTPPPAPQKKKTIGSAPKSGVQMRSVQAYHDEFGLQPNC